MHRRDSVQLKVGWFTEMNSFFFFSAQNESQIFPPTTGGAEKMAVDMEIPFLGKVPLDPRIGRCCDEGKSFLSEVPDSPAADAYKKIIQSMAVFFYTSQS